MTNLKTTVAGTLTILIPVVGGFLKRFYLNEPLTTTDWGIVSAAVATGCGLIFAGDAKTVVVEKQTTETKVP